MDELRRRVLALCDEWDSAEEPDGSASIAPVVSMSRELRALVLRTNNTSPFQNFLTNQMMCPDCHHDIDQHLDGACAWTEQTTSSDRATLIIQVVAQACACQLKPMHIVRRHIHRELEDT